MKIYLQNRTQTSYSKWSSRKLRFFDEFAPQTLSVTPVRLRQVNLRFRPIVTLPTFLRFWSSFRPISSSQLHTSLCFHLCPIYLVVFKGSSTLRSGDLILRRASRLDAFSVYPFPSWLPSRAIGMTTGPPADGPSRSSRTKDSPSQISCARAG